MLRLQQCRNRITASSNAAAVAKHNNALAAAHSLHAHTVLLLKPLHNLATSSDDRAHLALRNINHVVPAVHASVAVLAQQRCDRRTSCSDRVRLPDHSKRVPATHRVDLHVVLRFQITHRCAALANHCAHTTVRNRYLRTLRLQQCRNRITASSNAAPSPSTTTPLPPRTACTRTPCCSSSRFTTWPPAPMIVRILPSGTSITLSPLSMPASPSS